MNKDELINVDAEQAFLGSIILDGDYIHGITIEPGDLHVERHRWALDAMMRLRDDGVMVDPVTLSNKLQEMGKLSEFGGASEITRLVSRSNGTPPKNYEHILRTLSIRRDTYNLSLDLQRAALNETDDIRETRTGLAEKIATVKGTTGAVHVSEWMHRTLAKIKDLKANPRELVGLNTGLVGLNAIMGSGLMSGVTLVGGAPGQGKSMLAQAVADFLVFDGRPGVFYAAEMQEEDMSYRIISAQAGVEVSKMRTGKITTAELEVIEKAIARINKVPWFVLDPTDMTLAELRADLVRLYSKYKIEWMVFDYLELLGDQFSGLLDWQRSARLARGIVRVVKAIPGLKAFIIQKINKAGWNVTDQPPGLSSFSGGGDLAYDVTNALILLPHIPLEDGVSPDPNYRTVVQVKPQRNVESTAFMCEIWKHPTLPVFADEPWRGMESVNQQYKNHMREKIDIDAEQQEMFK